MRSHFKSHCTNGEIVASELRCGVVARGNGITSEIPHFVKFLVEPRGQAAV
jgi:hypothetical protein